MLEFVSYLRCSTGRQEASGLGIEAQREAVQAHAARNHATILAEFVETESGRKADRPELGRALAFCRRKRATLLISRLDRLARNVAFVSSLMESGIEFVAADAPFANRLMIHVLSAVAEWEREQISERTKAALAAAKARGVLLGSNGRALASANKDRALKHAESLRVAIYEARREGAHSLRQLCIYLDERGYRTAEGGRWHPSTVRRLLSRLEGSEPCKQLHEL